MFMRYLGGGIGHPTTATGPSSKEIDTTQVEGHDDTDSEMDPEEFIKDANHTQGPQVDNLEDPTEDDYERDVVAGGEVVVQDDELRDYKYTQGEEPEMDPKNEGLEDIDSCDLGPEDGEDDEYFHSDLEYD
jgi:hypothetical protein